jgi:hypothetical protein
MKPRTSGMQTLPLGGTIQLQHRDNNAGQSPHANRDKVEKFKTWQCASCLLSCSAACWVLTAF